MKWICEYAEYDTDLHNGYKGDPFEVEADTYEEAMKIAHKELDESYYVFEYDCYEVEEEEE